MKTVILNIISNEWFLTYNVDTKKIINPATYVNENHSAIVGENVGVLTGSTEDELNAQVKNLGLTE